MEISLERQTLIRILNNSVDRQNNLLTSNKSLKSEEYQVLDSALNELIETKRKFKSPDFQIELTCEVQNHLKKELSLFDRIEHGTKRNSIKLSGWKEKGAYPNTKLVIIQ